MNSTQITSTINKCYLFKIQVIELNFPKKFLDNNIKNYTNEEYKKDIEKLKSFDINLLYNKEFWGLNRNESICAIATEPYTKLKRILK